jgi:hypothetical protein
MIHPYEIFMTPFKNHKVAATFANYPDDIRQSLLELRELIIQTAAQTPGVGELEETLKWGEPAYLTSQSKSGSTIRIAWKSHTPSDYGMYFNCQTTLIGTFKTLFPNEFRFEGNRAIIFTVAETIPRDAILFCISAALTYHQKKLK